MSMNNDMNRTEDALKNALRRQQAPDGFADRVAARLAEQSSAPITFRDSWLRIFARPLVRWAAASAVSLALVVGGIHYRNLQRERAQGEAAKQRLILALRIAGSKLQLAKSKVQHIQAEQTENPEEKE